MNAPGNKLKPPPSPWKTAADVRALGDRLMSGGQNIRRFGNVSGSDLRDAARLLWHFTRDMNARDEIQIPRQE